MGWSTGQKAPDKDGSFVRADSAFRNWITRDGAPGPTGKGGFQAEVGRYHLIVALTCPWAHRTLIYLRLKGLESIISLGIVHPQRTSKGWSFHPFPGSTEDSVLNTEYLSDYYYQADSDYQGRFTVPILWDKAQRTIVSNESADIIRMFNSAFDEQTKSTEDYYPKQHRNEIDKINGFIYQHLNNGVYRAGFATSQCAYEEAYHDVFYALDFLESQLKRRRYLISDEPTEADWRLFPTLVRFDSVYYSLFKCNHRRLIDYPSLWEYTRRLYHHPHIQETVNFTHIKHGYWRKSDRNLTGIVPLGPELDFSLPGETESSIRSQ